MGYNCVRIPQQEGTGQVISTVMKSGEIQEHGVFFLQTNLTLEEGQSVIKSQIFQMQNPHQTKWQLELNPNFMYNDTRYLSFWVRLLESEKEEVETCYTATLITTPTDPDYTKAGGLFRYSMETPCHGFPTFIPMYRLQSNGNPLKDRFRFRLNIKLFSRLQDQLKMDATLIFNGDILKADSSRLSFYSSVFSSLFKDSSRPDLTVDISEFFDMKCMAESVVGFCHKGTLSSVPKDSNAMRKLIKLSDRLGMPMLKNACQNQCRKNLKLKPKYFAQNVALVKAGLLDEKQVMPMLMDFFLKHSDEIIDENEMYDGTYDENKDLYWRYVFGSPKGG